MPESKDLYLDLIKDCLLNWVFQEKEPPFDAQARAEGKEWPLSPIAQTMIGSKRLLSLQQQVERVISDQVPGDLIETGVWRGGATILMRAVLKAYGVTDRKVWVADSFRGLPAPDRKRYPRETELRLDTVKELAVSIEEVKANFDRYGLLDDQVRFLPGWFRESLPKAPIERLSLMRLDGDLYESTHVALTELYPKLSVGGYVIVDDFALDACRQAVEDYRAEKNIQDPITQIDWTGVYWRRSSS